jgi:hypothetical protein
MRPIAERCHRVLEPLHAMIHFAPELQEVLTGLGVRPGRMCAIASRVAPLGAVSLGAVSGAFYTFNPELIGRFVPRAWTLASPADIVAGRFAAAEAALRRLLGPEIIDSPKLAEAANLARAAAEGCFPAGRPMYAAHAEAPWPDEPHLTLWHAATLLREFRGDGHVAVLISHGLDGPTALVTHTATGEGFVEPAAKLLRGWSDEQWAEAVQRTQDAGLIDPAGRLTERGAALRRDLEDTTNRLAERPWSLLGPDKANRLHDLALPLARQVAAAGAFPDDIFAGRNFTKP